MAVKHRKLYGNVRPDSLDAKRFNKFVRENWGQPPLAFKNDGYSAPSGTTGDTNLLVGPKSVLQYFVIGAGQTILAPVWADATGLSIGLDATDNEGAEFHAGVGALSQGSFVVGTDRSFYVKATLNVADVSVTDELVLGFRKNEACQNLAGTYEGYTDFAVIGIITSAATAPIKIATRLNSGAVGKTDTTNTWADGATKTLKVVVDDAGSVKFFINEAAPTVVPTTFTFDSGDTVNWFLRHVRAATAANAVTLRPQSLTVGLDTVDQAALEYGYVRRNAE